MVSPSSKYSKITVVRLKGSTKSNSHNRISDYSFSEINECLYFGTCSHYCINTKGSYKCTCDKNYKDINGSCVAKGKDLHFPVISFLLHHFKFFLFSCFIIRNK